MMMTTEEWNDKPTGSNDGRMTAPIDTSPEAVARMLVWLRYHDLRAKLDEAADMLQDLATERETLAAQVAKLNALLHHGLQECARETVRAEAAETKVDAADAVGWTTAAAETLAGYNRDLGVDLPDTTEIGRIYESRDTPSFRIQVGHLRNSAAALSAYQTTRAALEETKE